MDILGPIIRLQIQRSPLKTGEKPHRRYDPAPILVAPRLHVDAEGAVALVNGSEVVDVHHRRHPASRQSRAQKMLSVGFTAHYHEIQDRYGEHMVLGSAGENIIVDTECRITLKDVAGGLVVLGPGGEVRARLGQAAVAAPCKPFSGFAHGYRMVDSATLKATLQFLDGGTRGFRCVLQGTDPVEFVLGDWMGVE